MSSGRIPSVEGGIQPTIVDAKGDLIVATAADTVSRLAVGSNDQVLTADSSTATGLKWAAAAAGGAYTQLLTGSLTGTSVTTSTIVGGYRNIVLVLDNVQNNSDWLFFRFNGVTGTNYCRNLIIYNSTTLTSGAGTTSFKTQIGGNSSYPLNGWLQVNEYATSTKGFSISAGFAGHGAEGFNYLWGQYFNSTAAAITSITIFGETSQTFTAGTYTLYGVK